MKKFLKSKYSIILVVILMFVMINVIKPFSKSEEIEEVDTKQTELVEEQNTDESEEEQIPVALSETNEITGTFENGNGTSSNPYKISTKEDMFLLAELVNNHIEDSVNGGYYNTKYYELTNDINLNNEEWTPIGTMPSDAKPDNTHTFQGNFNGNGYTVKNIKITVTSIPTYKSKYGLFGALYSTSSSNKAMVYNLELDNMNINVSASGTCGIDILFGTIAGNIGQNSSIINCIVKNSSISIENGFTLEKTKLLAIGGVVGDTAKDATSDNSSYAEVSEENRYSIENCYADVDITVNDESWTQDNSSNVYYQYNIGGIIGRIRRQNRFPQNCVYKGTVKSTKAFIGPIYGCARYDTSSDRSVYLNTYLGLDTSDSSIGTMSNGYFYNYKIINGKEHDIGENYKEELTEVELGGITGYSLGDSYMEKVQGVNRGTYTTSLRDGRDMLNTYNGINSTYNKWYYDFSNDTLTFKEVNEDVKLELKEDENEKYKYNAEIVDGDVSGKKVTYNWYIDSVEVLEGVESNTINLEEEFEDRILRVELLLDGKVVTSISLLIPAETLKMQIKIKNEQNEKILYVYCETSLDITTSDYTYEWYKQNSETLEFEKLKGNSYECKITPQNEDVYKVKATYKGNNEKYDREVEYVYTSVIYVNNTETTINDVTYQVGNDNNNGIKPETAVKTIEAAYNLLIDTNEVEENIIVIMGTYQDKFSSMTFSKPATITGVYSDVDYVGTIQLIRETSIFLNADTIFKNITFDGKNGSKFIYCRGNDLTMDVGVKMINFLNAPTAWATPSTNYPAITIIGGWINYSENIEIPQDVCNITIKSGHYARIIGGGRTGTDDMESSSSEEGESDIFGTLTNPYKVRITIDIKENTESEKNYDADIGLLVGGQADGSCYINNEINLINGTVGCLIGGNIGYGRIIENRPDDSFFGSTTVNLSGGEVNELYGGSLGRNDNNAYFYGKINISITGTIVNNNVYGSGAGGTTGYSEESTDLYKNYAEGKSMEDLNGNTFYLDDTKPEKNTVEINIEKNAQINGSIYGAGYGYSKFLNKNQVSDDGGALYGNTSISITGGTIQGNIYGGGKGTDVYGETKDKLACINGNITISISGKPTINGNVYGGSEGIKGYKNMAKVTGNISVNIKTDSSITGNIYGGGKEAIVYGSTKVDINNSTINGSVFGGGDEGDVISGTEVKIYGGSNVTEAVYGGGNNADIGTAENNANSKVVVYDADIGDISTDTISGGEVFGGGNYGKVYGDTVATVGSTRDGVCTNIGLQFYAGGRGDAESITVYRNF